MTNASGGVGAWIWCLRVLSLLNVAVWLRVASAVQRESALQGPELRRYRYRQLVLAGLFVFGCAFRSILPRADVQRICPFDTWLSVVFVGRAVATVAELAFMAQWALLLRDSAGPGPRDLARLFSRVLVPLIAIAELCSWYAVLSTNYLGNGVEQSIWTFAAALVVVGPLSRERGARPRFVGIATALIGVLPARREDRPGVVHQDPLRPLRRHLPLSQGAAALAARRDGRAREASGLIASDPF